MTPFNTKAEAKKFCKKHSPDGPYVVVLVYNDTKTRADARFLSDFTGEMHYAGAAYYYASIEIK